MELCDLIAICTLIYPIFSHLALVFERDVYQSSKFSVIGFSIFFCAIKFWHAIGSFISVAGKKSGRERSIIMQIFMTIQRPMTIGT